MRKEWQEPIMDELSINMTANGAVPEGDFDGPWEQLPDGTYWRPGASK